MNSSSVRIRYTYAGDANLDGFVSGDDYTAIDFAIAAAGTAGYANGDFNYDGFISGDDYTVIDFNIAAQGSAFGAAAPDRFSVHLAASRHDAGEVEDDDDDSLLGVIEAV